MIYIFFVIPILEIITFCQVLCNPITTGIEILNYNRNRNTNTGVELIANNDEPHI